MNRTIAYVVGPELVWLMMFAVTSLLVSRNQPPTEAGNQRLELIGWFLPLIGVALSFVPLAWAPGSQWWWLARIILVGAVGVVIVTGHLCGGIDYSDSRNSGVGTAYILFIGLGFMALMAGGVVAAFFFLTKWRFLPFLRWGLIVLAVLGAIWGIICWLASFAKPSTP